MSRINVDIDIYDVYLGINNYDREKMIDWLKRDGYIDNNSEGYDILPSTSPLESQFHNHLIKLSSKFYSMSNEEVKIIENLYKKYC